VVVCCEYGDEPVAFIIGVHFLDFETTMNLTHVLDFFVVSFLVN
jgi:hypothetical protein